MDVQWNFYELCGILVSLVLVLVKSLAVITEKDVLSCCKNFKSSNASLVQHLNATKFEQCGVPSRGAWQRDLLMVQ